LTLYLDTSSLVKIYTAESGIDAVLEVVDKATVVATSVIAYAEARAALASRQRDGSLSRSLLAAAKRELEDDWPAYLAVEITHAVSRSAGEFAERFRLRGYDAVHLACFESVVNRVEHGDVRFSSFDDRLNAAAQALLRARRRTRYEKT
jgi:predicted nucleic acid-binding protein